MQPAQQPAPPSSLAALPPAPPTFGLLVAGRPVQTDWRLAGPDKLLTEVAAPAGVAELAVFALPGVALPPDRGVLIFAAPPPFTAWTTLGALGPGKPSAVIRTGWAANPEFAGAPVVQVGLSVEPADAVANAASALSAGEWDKLGFAQLIARDLTAYMTSFAAPTPAGERLVLPPDAVSRWYAKFEAKFRAQGPGFLYRHKE